MPNPDFAERQDDLNSYLEHHGVKGQKWGVRNNRSGAVKARATIAMYRRSVASEDSTLRLHSKHYQDVYDRTFRDAAHPIRKGIRTLNKDDRYKGKDFRQPSALRKQYYKEASNIVTRELNASASKSEGRMGRGMEMHFQMNISESAVPTVTLKQRAASSIRKQTREDNKAQRAALKAESKIQHSDEEPNEESFEGKLITDDNGYILDFDFGNNDEVSMNSSEQSTTFEDECDNFLQQWGVRGMKWGKRKARTSDSESTESADAQSVRKIKSKKVKSMSNKDLQDATKRLQLEDQYRQLSAKDKAAHASRGSKITKGLLSATTEIGGNVGKQLATDYVKRIATAMIEEKLRSSGSKYAKS